MAPRTVLLVGALSLTAGWLLGNATSWFPGEARRSTASSSGPRALGLAPGGSQAGRQSSERRPAGKPAGDAPLTRQLRQRLDTQPPSTPAAGRNPFTFGASRTPVSPYRESSPVAELPPPVPLPPPAPQFKLSGIASNLVDGTTVWTAIINDNGSLAFVKTGDALSNGHRVVRVEETGVVLIDADGITQTLRLP